MHYSVLPHHDYGGYMDEESQSSHRAVLTHGLHMCLMQSSFKTYHTYRYVG